MDLKFEKLHEDFGAKISSFDPRKLLSKDFATQIMAAIDEYSFLHFPKQVIDESKHLTFTKLLGIPEINHVKFGQEGVKDYFYTIGNVQGSGRALPNSHKTVIFQTGNNMWHSDSSFQKTPAFATITYACETPTVGGETEFVSCRSAYTRLPDLIKKEIDRLIVVHDYVFSRSKVSQDAVTPSHAVSLPPVRHKLVSENTAIRRKNYYIGSHAKEIEGWGLCESRRLLDDLLERATRADYIYTHQWEKGDFVIWDNRCLLHRGKGYDANLYRRRLRQTRVKEK